MTDSIPPVLERGGLIEITTVGLRSGGPRRIEIAIHHLDGRLWISGMPHPSRRSWIANLDADPRLTVHVKGDSQFADVPATARIVDDLQERRQVLEQIARVWRRTDVDRMVEQSPLIEVVLDRAD